MATPIPGFASQVLIDDNTDSLQVTTGSAQVLAQTRWYYLVSNRTATTNGQSLLYAIKTKLDASLAGTVWQVTLGTGFKIQISHDNVASRTVTFDANLATYLGFASASFAVAASTTVTATNYSLWWWTPDQPINETGPVPFDPTISFGVPSSAGTAQRSSDMTAAYTVNGTQYAATYTFRGVQYYYKIRPQSGYTYYDLETWWSNGPRNGRRCLMWRDRTNATGSTAPSEGTATPWNYIEYQPDETLRGTFPAVPTAPPNLFQHDVVLSFWLTENNESPLSD